MIKIYDKWGVYIGLGTLEYDKLDCELHDSIVKKIINDGFIYDNEIFENISKLLENHQSKYKLCLK
jgi:hypothetical protein